MEALDLTRTIKLYNDSDHFLNNIQIGNIVVVKFIMGKGDNVI